MEKYCGVDVHKKRFNAAIVVKDRVVDTGEFTNDFIDEYFRKLRRLTRMREKLVNARTSIKNAAHGMVDTFSAELTQTFSDTFGKSSKKAIKIVLSSSRCELKEKLREAGIKEKKIEEITNAMDKAYVPSIDAWSIKFYMDSLSKLDEMIETLESAIASMVKSDEKVKKNIELLMSIPGVGFITAATVMAEVCDVSRFPTPKKLVGWSGLAPRGEEFNKCREELTKKKIK